MDQADLRIWCSSHPELAESLDALLEVNLDEALTTHLSRKESNSIIRDMALNKSNRIERQKNKGTKLCLELKSIKKGKASWRQYEKKCEEILKYLFPNDLHGWHSQKRTDDG
ncbi:TPA: hypothetical protein N5L69_004396, partial [Enterobacter hormaechei subsp. steigerwaltii]|nr:hypothetical protein [Enterobacter hormaechei subsp. steigerwaltii]